MRVLVTGARGQLGTDLLLLLSGRGADGGEGGADDRRVAGTDGPVDVTGVDLPEVDLTDRRRTRDDLMGWSQAGAEGERLLVVNCAAWTAVDAAEDDEDAARRVNADAAGHLAEACAEVGATLVHVSTDYVFDGERPPDAPAWEPDDPVAPRSAYGRTKAEGERLVHERCPDARVVRTAWLYGAHGANFVATVVKAHRERGSLDVVADQHGSPTWSWHLASRLVALGGPDVAPGTYHAAGSGATTWHGLAAAAVELDGGDPASVRPTDSSAYVRPAPRPAFSVLSPASLRRAGVEPLPVWDAALREAWPVLRAAGRV